jgi:hypothetical protein
MNLVIGKGFSGALPEAAPQMELRPLGFGEIFDRAITLYLRNFVPFFAIVLVLIVPDAVLQYVFDSSQATQLNDIIRVLAHPHAKSTFPLMAFDRAQLITIGVNVVVFYLLYPFVLNAVAVGVARLYRGYAVEFTACYATVIKRWTSILLLLLLEILVAIAWYVLFAVSLGFALAIALLMLRAFAPVGVIFVIGVVLLALAGLVVLAVTFIALSFAMYSVVLEELSPSEALRLGFVRVFSKEEFWRAALFALAATAVEFGASLVIGIFASIALLLHQVALEVVLKSLLNAAFMPFAIVLIAVYYFDVRIRREGFDLEAELDRLSTGSLVA